MAKRNPSAVGDELASLLAILNLVRTKGSLTRPQLGELTGYGRTVVTQRTQDLIDGGLIEDGEFAASTGGRAPRVLRINRAGGHILVAQVAVGLSVGLCDLAGRVTDQEHIPVLADTRPEAVLELLERMFEKLMMNRGEGAPPIRGIGVGLPGPVDFAGGVTVSPTYFEGWAGFPIRDRLHEKFGVPTWVDNHVNLMTQGELRVGVAREAGSVVFLEVGPGVGAGLVSGGKLHRGAKGAAGHIGHTPIRWDDPTPCRCGSTGCLEAIVGRTALIRQATEIARAGASPRLARRLEERGQLELGDIVDAAAHQDGAAAQLLAFAGERAGEMLATFVNFVNPELVVVGGELGRTSDAFLAALRESLYRRALPLSTRDLAIERTALGGDGVLHGAAHMVLDELFSPGHVRNWFSSESSRKL